MQEINIVFMAYGVLANICATDRANEIFAALPYRCAIIDEASTVLPVLWDISLEGEAIIDSQTIMSNLIENNILHTYPLQREQHCHMYVLLGSCLRQELADLFTLASVHSAGVTLDDPVIRKRVMQILPTVPIHSTLSILHHWHTTTRLPNSETQQALRRIVQHAHFQPSDDDPLFPWWTQFLSDEEALHTHEH